MELVGWGWGQDNPTFRQVFTSRFIPGGSHEQLQWFNDLCLKTTSGEIAADLRRGARRRGYFRLAAPKCGRRHWSCTREATRWYPIEEGRLVASGIPGAEFVELDSRNHILLEHEPAWQRFRDAVARVSAAGGHVAMTRCSPHCPRVSVRCWRSWPTG